MGRRCGNVKCCQAFTQRGTKCSRPATLIVDLSKSRKILGYQLPRAKCCFFCSQHASILLGVAVQKIAQTAAEYFYDWNEYIVLHPEYLSESAKNLSIADT